MGILNLQIYILRTFVLFWWSPLKHRTIIRDKQVIHSLSNLISLASWLTHSGDVKAGCAPREWAAVTLACCVRCPAILAQDKVHDSQFNDYVSHQTERKLGINNTFFLQGILFPINLSPPVDASNKNYHPLNFCMLLTVRYVGRFKLHLSTIISFENEHFEKNNYCYYSITSS